MKNKISHKKSICVVLILAMVMSFGCGEDKTDIQMEYSGTNVANKEIKDIASVRANNNLVGHGVCVVDKGKDVGDDSAMTATSSLIFCVDDENAIYANNIYNKIYPASITKIFTTLTVFKSNHKLDEMVTVGKNAQDISKNPGAQYGGLCQGDRVKLKDLLYFLLIYSANDAGIAIAEHVGGSVENFVNMMNTEAKKVGCVCSNFVNPHGLHDDKHYTSAYDIYLVFNQLLKNSVFLDIIGRDVYSLPIIKKDGTTSSIRKEATNKYISGNVEPPDGITVLGGKTGTTDQAGKCLIIGSKDQKGKKYISLVLNAKDDNDLYPQMNNLLSKIK